ncbi:TetR/AcrR family transcriptional regulator [Marinitenerispora sediminis]|uniref:TetR family transcriptional regulator n=1 Tax=Marinitenerispora sediminis TaxID=1931232 RepID=A0A368T5B5_9ACTN|nr:TetR/AcrR family transcriptional regulator [Marinitenerispora sediminis]RCV57446.1 TetR family transcriptional regulator [Marinitenerispora sediminis]RCV58805.1 TetR family transcriptional regulator [Marinitenerispora sediminis]RCV61288.1 TetR family transcriptional regulator [Marinitenerispora sediminis]
MQEIAPRREAAQEAEHVLVPAPEGGERTEPPPAAEPRSAGLSARGRATRDRLVAAARAGIIAGDGTLEVADIAARTGTSVGLLYRYFGSKDGLVSEVVNEFYDSYDAVAFRAAARAGERGGWLATEYQRIRREIDFLCDHQLARVIVGRRLREPAAAQVDAARLAGQVDVAAGSIARAQHGGELAADIRPRFAAAAILGAFRELMAQALSRECPPPRQELLDVMWRTSTSLLLPTRG